MVGRIRKPTVNIVASARFIEIIDDSIETARLAENLRVLIATALEPGAAPVTTIPFSCGYTDWVPKLKVCVDAPSCA